MRELVIYHKNCKDGIGSASAYSLLHKDMMFKAIQHGEKDKEFFLENLTDEEFKCDKVVFLDFSLDTKQLIDCCNVFQEVLVIDHHKTFEEDSKSINHPNLKVIFDNDKSGTILTWEYVSQTKDIEDIFPLEIARYIQDRDLWNWELLSSKEFSAGLDFLSQKDYDKELSEVMNFLLLLRNSDIGRFIKVGALLLEKDSYTIASKTKEDKICTITLDGVEMSLINTTTLISEMGNEMCLKYNRPAMMFFVLENGDVIFSLRSTNELPDVSVIAKIYGGGGHRNACGFKSNLSFLSSLYKLNK